MVMYLTDPEYDFWPWTWHHDQKECKSIEDMIAAWKTIDPYKDATFDPRKQNHTNEAGDFLKTKKAENIECETHQADISLKITLDEYKEYALMKFDQQMQKIVNKNKKVAVGLSGGVDSTLTLAWLVKNKVDFESFVVRGDPWRGYMSSITESNAIEIAKVLGVKNHVVDFNETDYNTHAMIRQYCAADQYDMPCISLMTQPPASMYLRDNPFDGMIVAPVGTDDLLLHRQSSWIRFIPDDMLIYLRGTGTNFSHITDYGYKLGNMGHEWKEKIDPSLDKQVMHRWEDDLLFQMFKKKICSPATSRDWFETWHRIDNQSCDHEQLKDLMGVGWLKRQIAEWASDEIIPMVKHVPCTEKFYTPDEETKEYILGQCKKAQESYRAEKNLTQQIYWRGNMEIIKMFNKITPELVQSIHTLNWLSKNG